MAGDCKPRRRSDKPRKRPAIARSGVDPPVPTMQISPRTMIIGTHDGRDGSAATHRLHATAPLRTTRSTRRPRVEKSARTEIFDSQIRFATTNRLRIALPKIRGFCVFGPDRARFFGSGRKNMHRAERVENRSPSRGRLARTQGRPKKKYNRSHLAGTIVPASFHASRRRRCDAWRTRAATGIADTAIVRAERRRTFTRRRKNRNASKAPIADPAWISENTLIIK